MKDKVFLTYNVADNMIEPVKEADILEGNLNHLSKIFNVQIIL